MLREVWADGRDQHRFHLNVVTHQASVHWLQGRKGTDTRSYSGKHKVTEKHQVQHATHHVTLQAGVTVRIARVLHVEEGVCRNVAELHPAITSPQ